MVSDTQPQPGDDVWLTIDIDLQAHAEKLLAERIDQLRGGTTRDGRSTEAPQGSVVITDPTTGEVLAMASHPTYDPRLLVNGISSDLWEQLQDPEGGLPLNNWAMQGTYAPGSTFKPITALAGMRSGFIHPGNDTYDDSGTYQLQGCTGGKCEFRNAGRGQLRVGWTCPVPSPCPRTSTTTGSARTCGSAAAPTARPPSRTPRRTSAWGRSPASSCRARPRVGSPHRSAVSEAYEANPDLFMTGEWFTGDNVITAIGQGDVLVTPLQLNSVYATLANGGEVMRPHVVYRTTRALDATVPPGEPGNYEVVRTIEPEERARVEMTPEQYVAALRRTAGRDPERLRAPRPGRGRPSRPPGPSPARRARPR